MDDEFSPDPSKQAQELSFSRGLGWKCHILIYFLTMQKFRKQILKNTLEWTKVRKTIGLLHKLNSILTRAALVTIFKDFIGPHLDCDCPVPSGFWQRFSWKLGIESVQCMFRHVAGAIRVTSRDKLYQILRLKVLQLRRCYRKLCSFYSILKNQSSQYL